jgi:hypothetical protein
MFKRHNVKKLYNTLIKWDEKKTVLENCEAINCSIVKARNLICKYNLKFTRSPFKKRRQYSNDISRGYIKKWDTSKTLEENAKILGVNLSRASCIANNYGLSWTKEYKSGLKLLHQARCVQNSARENMLLLRINGMTLKQVGNVYGVTRERVRQMTS